MCEDFAVSWSSACQLVYRDGFINSSRMGVVDVICQVYIRLEVATFRIIMCLTNLASWLRPIALDFLASTVYTGERNPVSFLGVSVKGGGGIHVVRVYSCDGVTFFLWQIKR